MNRLFICLLAACLGLSGCIEDDIPVRTVVCKITEMAVEGMVSCKIQEAASTVNIQVADTLDLRNLRVEKLLVTEGAAIFPDSAACLQPARFPATGFEAVDSLPATADTRMNFRQPVRFRLSLYQDYEWTVNVKHALDRKIRVKNQVGYLIDENTKNLVIYVDSAAQPSFRNIEVLELRLGSSVAVTRPDPAAITDFTRPRLFRVTAFGDTEEWTVSVRFPPAGMQKTELSAWAKRAYIKGATKTGNVALEYRAKGEDSWESMLSNELTVDGENFLATMTHLKPSTDYEYRLTVDSETQDIETFRTDTAQQLPNLSFDEWHQEGNIWYPNKDLSDAFYFWDSGNKGTSIAGGKNPSSQEKSDVVKGSALRMASAYVVVKFAAGNIYSGSFFDLDGMNALLDFGRPYQARPSALKGYYKYTSGVVDYAGSRFQHMLGEKDSCHIYIALFSDWTSPFRVNSKTETFVDLTWNNESLLAFGELKTDQSIADYQSFRIPLTYRDYFTKPTYVLMVASASKYGDYFTGSSSSVLLLDECELVFE